jgi:hypothetical protein
MELEECRACSHKKLYVWEKENCQGGDDIADYGKEQMRGRDNNKKQ